VIDRDHAEVCAKFRKILGHPKEGGAAQELKITLKSFKCDPDRSVTCDFAPTSCRSDRSVGVPSIQRAVGYHTYPI
jgi:hypothetical protein